MRDPALDGGGGGLGAVLGSSFDSPDGRIEVAWVRKDGTVELTVRAEKAEVIVFKARQDVQWKFRDRDRRK